MGILTSVNCSTTVAGFIAKEIERSGILDDFPNIDGIVALKQANGCVIDYRGVIFDTLKKTTWGYATNPNMGGVIMVGLGCEGFQIPRLKEAHGGDRERDVPDHDHPGSGRHEKDRRGRRRGGEGDAAHRQPGAARDGTGFRTDAGAAMRRLGRIFGITANPALGVAADILVRHGGTAILSETRKSTAPSTSSSRARSREVREKSSTSSTGGKTTPSATTWR